MKEITDILKDLQVRDIKERKTKCKRCGYPVQLLSGVKFCARCGFEEKFN